MTRPILADLHGAALDDAMGRCFSLAEETVDIGGRVVTLVKPANADHLISEADYVMDERLPYWADLWPSARVLAAIVGFCKDPVPNIRFNAAKALARLSANGKLDAAAAAGVRPALTLLTKDPDDDVRFFAEKAVAVLVR